MVTNSTLDSTEEGAGISERKVMENTINKKPEDSPSLKPKLSETPPETDIPPEAVVTWLMMSVAVGLFSVYTMVQWISHKLAQEIEKDRAIEKRNAADVSVQTDGKQKDVTTAQDTSDSAKHHQETDLQTAQENESQSKRSNNSVSNTGSLENLAVDVICKDNGQMKVDDLSGGNSVAPGESEAMLNGGHVIEEESKDTVKTLDTNRGTHPVWTDVNQCTHCQSDGHVMSTVQMGPGFTGNLSISSEATAENGELTETKTLESTTATLQTDYDQIQSSHVTVNHLPTRCLTCNAEVSQNKDARLTSPVRRLSDCNDPYSNTDGQQLSKITAGAACTAQHKIESPEHQPSSTITCMKTTLKSLRCHLPEANETKPKTVHNCSSNCNTLQCSNKNTIRLPSHGCSAVSKDTENKEITTTVSPSLNYLAIHHTPQDTTDGSLLSKSNSEDAFIFPQDNETAKENQTVSCFTDKSEIETPRSRFLKEFREENPALSKSLDLEIERLGKESQLLEKKPLKSALKCSGSEECLTKKYVHFPEDIRNIRTVHKYRSFDESCLNFDPENTTK